MPRESANTRLLLSALAERLIYGDGDTFSRQDALDLAELLPSPGWRARLAEWLPDVGVRGSLPGASAAGVGNTSIARHAASHPCTFLRKRIFGLDGPR